MGPPPDIIAREGLVTLTCLRMACVGLFYLGLCLPTRAEVTVSVTDDGGKPLADIAVACTDGVRGLALSDALGLTRLPDGCWKVACESGNYLPAEAKVVDGTAACTMRKALLLTVRPLPAPCRTEEGCLVFAVSDSGRRVGATSHHYALVAGTHFFDTERVHLGATPPGRYRLGIGLFHSSWHCWRFLPDLPAGETTVSPVWREPQQVMGQVLDAQGRPRANILVYVLHDPALIQAGDGATCEIDPKQSEAVSDAQGRFTLLYDPAIDIAIVAGDPDDPLGMASRPLPPASDAEIILQLGSPR